MDHIETHFAALDNVRLHYVTAGPEDGPPVLLLHGFPEFWYGWRHQIPALAAAGYRVIAPDQRGYNLSDRPRDWQAYDMNLLAADMLGLMDHLGYEKVHLVGHDWGGQVAWWLAIFHPERFHDLSILNVPHPYVMSRNLRKNRRQLLKSWYIFFFQIPWLPEFLLGLGDNAGLANLLRRSGKPGTFTAEDIARYREAWRQPGAVRGMLNWYRAIMRRASQPKPRGKITLPTLILWGEQDVALSVEMAEQSAALCSDARLMLFPDATHWVASDAADEVNAELMGFFGRQ